MVLGLDKHAVGHLGGNHPGALAGLTGTPSATLEGAALVLLVPLLAWARTTTAAERAGARHAQAPRRPCTAGVTDLADSMVANC